MLRIGQGFDVHKFADIPAESGYIMIGGVEVPSEFDILAHSDGDVVLHALCDALLGAVALGDIGEHFSDQDDAFKNKNSDWFVLEVMKKVKAKGYGLINADVTIIAERPRISRFKGQMCHRIAELLELPTGAVNVKATTTEKLGFTGRKEGIAAQAVVLLQLLDTSLKKDSTL